MKTPFNSHWLETGACVPVDIETTAILLEEIRRLHHDAFLDQGKKCMNNAKLTEEQIWKCNQTSNHVHICLDHQNVVDFARAIEREIGFAKAELWIKRMNDAVAAEREACAELVWPKLKIWSEEEQLGMDLAFKRAQEKHGWYETLMAVGASILKIKAAAIRARGQT